MLLRLDEEFAHDELKIKHTIKRKRLMRLIDQLRRHQELHKKVSHFILNSASSPFASDH